MSTSRLENLITKVRNQTGNQAYGDSSGISQTQFEHYFNDGLSFLQETLSTQHAAPSHFLETKDINVVSGTESYSLPDTMLTSGGILEVRYKHSDNQWKKLEPLPVSKRSRLTDGVGTPYGYTRINRSIYLINIPNESITNGLKVTYIKRFDRLGVRRGTIDSVSGTTTLTALSVDESTLLSTTEHGYDSADYICIVDRDGNFKVRNIPIDDVNTSNGNITINGGSFTLGTDDTTPSNGDFVVFGKNTSTHQLDLDDTVGRFLTEYATWRVLQEDSNIEDQRAKLSELTSMRDSIIESYGSYDDDVMFVPELN